MARLLDEFAVDVPNSGSTLAVKLYSSLQSSQKQLMLQPQDARLQLDGPMLFWADCTLTAQKNQNEIVAVGWAQTMTTTVVEFCYTTPTHGFAAELHLTPSPCADGGQGIWYGGPNTAALQFLGSAYANHQNDSVYFGLVNYDVCQSGGKAFQPQAHSKRAILSDAPFIAVPEQARLTGVAGTEYTVAAPVQLNLRQLVGEAFTMGHGSPQRIATNTALLANAQLECIKARYRFTTYFCTLATMDASTVADAVQAYAFAEIAWEANYCANITATATRKNWQVTGPLKISNTGAKVTSYAHKNGQQIQRCPGLSCNLGARGVVFDYRQLTQFR